VKPGIYTLGDEKFDIRMGKLRYIFINHTRISEEKF
jgi:hypothetical protein